MLWLTLICSSFAEDARIPAQDLTLEGTLALPDGPGPHPGVVLVHGSGPNGRDAVMQGQLNMGFVRKVPVFSELSDALVAEGFAVLRYDKRSCGTFNKLCDNAYPVPPDDLTIDVFMDDAVAALTWLSAHDAVDPERVAVVGHSQGATFVPQILVEQPQLAAGVVIAGTFRPIDQILAQQLADSRALMRELGVPDGRAEAAVAPLVEMVSQVDHVRAGGFSDDTQMLGGASVGFWKSWLAQTDAMPGFALQAQQPMLVLGGTMDTNVPPAEIELWRAHLPEQHTVTVLDCVTHALTCVSEPDITKVKPKHLGKHVDARVPVAVTHFLRLAFAQDAQPSD
jgi:dienelactone hydrolase